MTNPRNHGSGNARSSANDLAQGRAGRDVLPRDTGRLFGRRTFLVAGGALPPLIILVGISAVLAWWLRRRIRRDDAEVEG
jgi:hypothetical protein